MEQQVQLSVVSVASRDVKRRSDGQMFKLYDVTLSDGNTYTTSKRDTAEYAHGMTGKPALCTIKVEQNGVYTNRYLNAIQSLDGAFGITQPSTTAPPTQTTFTTSPIPDTSSEKEDRIMRQAAAKVSAQLSSTPAEFWGNLDHMMDWFRLGKKPDWFTSEPQPAPASQLGPSDDIPFAPSI